MTVVVTALAGFIFFGGTNRLAGVLKKLVPIMAGIYILGSLTFIFMHIAKLPDAFLQILVGAFESQAIMGGATGFNLTQGALLKVNLVWEMADFFNGLMIIPNVLALIKSVHVVRDTKVCSTVGEEAKETA